MAAEKMKNNKASTGWGDFAPSGGLYLWKGVIEVPDKDT